MESLADASHHLMSEDHLKELTYRTVWSFHFLSCEWRAQTTQCYNSIIPSVCDVHAHVYTCVPVCVHVCVLVKVSLAMIKHRH